MNKEKIIEKVLMALIAIMLYIGKEYVERIKTLEQAALGIGNSHIEMQRDMYFLRRDIDEIKNNLK